MFILGILLTTGTIVLADNIGASEISYKETNVENALDDLYTKATTYKKLDTTTTATANDILNGKTVYDNNGSLLTGSIPTYSGSLTVSPEYVTDI